MPWPEAGDSGLGWLVPDFPREAMSTVVLRQWKDDDLDSYAQMNADLEVTRHPPAPLSRRESRESLERMRDAIERRGWGVWAVDVDGVFAGATGLAMPQFHAPFMPCTEVLWRFRRIFRGRGVARSAASQALIFGFLTLGLAEIVAFTAASNIRSIRLMERLAFNRDVQGDFEHPAIPQGHPLRHHVLYRRSPSPSPDPMPAQATRG
jgi:RimJ/RimL family protein N-acetyltransferase